MKAVVSIAVVGLALTLQDQVVPVHEEPRHRMIFETASARVLDIQIPPGETTLYHTHRQPILYVTMSTSRTRNQNHGGEWSAAPAPAGAKMDDSNLAIAPTSPPGRMMSTTSYAEKPQTHRVNNIGETLFRLIGVTNESDGDASEAPSASFDSKPEIANRWFRGYRHVLQKDETVGHTHDNPVAVVLAAGATTLEMKNAERRVRSADVPGFIGYVVAGDGHTLRGLAADTHVIEVEVRQPR